MSPQEVQVKRRTTMTQEMSEFILFILCACFAFSGTIANSISLSYFVGLVRSKTRPTNIIGHSNSSIFLTLALFDLLVCITTGCRVTLKLLSPHLGLAIIQKSPRVVLAALLLISVDITSFLTCILSVVRALNLLKPYFLVDHLLIGVSIVIYILIDIALGIPQFVGIVFANVASIVRIGMLLLIFIIVVLCNAFCMVKLSQSNTAKWKRHSTITVAILSFIFCVTNVGYIIVFGYSLLFSWAEEGEISRAYQLLFLHFLLPFNSTCNPMVYFGRSLKMRKHLTKICRKQIGHFKNPTIQN